METINSFIERHFAIFEGLREDIRKKEPTHIYGEEQQENAKKDTIIHELAKKKLEKAFMQFGKEMDKRYSPYNNRKRW